MGSDLERVLMYGSSRLGYPDLPWKERASFPTYAPRNPNPRHDQFVIASPRVDLWEDAAQDDGTLAHKLRIYADPFITIYRSSGLRTVGKEASANPHNQGTHFEFLKDQKEVLDSVWPISDVLKFI
jgi:hypothetical protein